MPDEIFAPHLREIWLERLSLGADVSFKEFAGAALRYSTSFNGVVGFKVHWLHVTDLAREAGCDPGDVLFSLLPGARFLQIVRRDRRAQALSWFRAEMTNEWFRFRNDTPAKRLPRLDFDMVRALEADIAAQELGWQEYFEERGVTPLMVEYEVLATSYRAELRRVLRFLGLDEHAAGTIPEPIRVRQADGLTECWRRRIDKLESRP